jgi:hypothetical protein
MGGNLTGTGVMQILSLPDYQRLLALLENLPNVVVSANAAELPRLQYNKTVLVNDRVHPNCMAAKMDMNDCVEI